MALAYQETTTTCDSCLQGRHRCYGCACSVCMASSPLVRRAKKKKRAPRPEPTEDKPKQRRGSSHSRGGYKNRGRSQLPPEVQEEIKALLKEGESLSELAKKYDTTRDKVRTLRNVVGLDVWLQAVEERKQRLRQEERQVETQLLTGFVSRIANIPVRSQLPLETRVEIEKMLHMGRSANSIANELEISRTQVDTIRLALMGLRHRDRKRWLQERSTTVVSSPIPSQESTN